VKRAFLAKILDIKIDLLDLTISTIQRLNAWMAWQLRRLHDARTRAVGEYVATTKVAP
jgi:hypothetical protein